MYTATKANVRTAVAASEGGAASALNIAFFGGSIMGLTVAAMGLVGIGILFYNFGGDLKQIHAIEGFAMGASSVALFSRVGGGIFTKSADVGADLVGKVEAGIPEDDPRNPGVIADNVGDNVGDVAVWVQIFLILLWVNNSIHYIGYNYVSFFSILAWRKRKCVDRDASSTSFYRSYMFNLRNSYCENVFE